MRFVVSHPTGNNFVRALLEELQKRSLLSNFYTTIGFGNDCSALFSKIQNRRKYNIPDDKIKRLWIPEIQRLLLNSDQETNRRLADRSYKKLDYKTAEEISAGLTKVIHTYEDGAFKTFIEAKKKGIQCSYELPIVHWATSRRLLAEEAERYPEWEPTLETTREPEEKLFQKEEELRLADRINCPSQFVLDSIPLEIRQKTPCRISQFGSPMCEPIDFEGSTHSDTLKLLFVGSMSQRKGLADVFDAMKLLKGEPISLSILGQPSMPMEFYREQLDEFAYFKPCSNSKIREIMKTHDALVLPSIVEGRALVQQEALSCGIPIIVTPNAGGEDLIEEGITGHLVPIRSPEKIAEAIRAMIENKNQKEDIRKLCQKKAKQYTWASYAQNIIEFNLSNSEQGFEIA